MENSFLEKILTLSVKARKNMLEIKHKKLSIRRRCKLLSLNRSKVYYKEANSFDGNEALIRKIDKICYPFYGYRHSRATLKRKRHLVNSKHIFRLVKQMDLMAIFSKLNLSKANKEHKIFPSCCEKGRLIKLMKFSQLTSPISAHGLVAIMD